MSFILGFPLPVFVVLFIVYFLYLVFKCISDFLAFDLSFVFSPTSVLCFLPLDLVPRII